MKREWTVRRQFVQQAGGQRRWDLAYQYLLRWAQAADQKICGPPLFEHR